MTRLEKISVMYNLTGEEILPPNQRRVTDQAKFTYTPLEKEEQKQLNKSNLKKNNYVINNKVIMNYCFQRKLKYLKGSIK